MILADLVMGGAGLMLILSYLTLVILSPKAPITADSELEYQSANSLKRTLLPSNLDTEPSYALSIVIPAYNEANRLGIMLKDAIKFLESKHSVTKRYEVIIVDDGSKDDTTGVALRLARELTAEYNSNGRTMKGDIKVVTLVKNRGKGGSVKHGMLHSSGERVLFVDADGASNFQDLALLQAEMNLIDGAYGVVVGSRAHLVQTEAVVKRSFLRNLLMRLFHTYLYLLGIRHIRDTQCGFKLHTRAAVATIYPLLHSPSWIFDCEVLLLASLAGIETREVGIRWQEVEGSKVDLVRDSIKMASDLIIIRANYILGRWETPKRVHSSVDEKLRKSQ